jgi:poly(3-hydroxybutyrate) depolymerase
LSSGSLRVPTALRRYFGVPVGTAGGPTTPGRWIHHHHTGKHGSRIYDVYLPAGLNPRAPVPLVLLLHGCRQGSADIAQESGFTAAVDTEGLVVWRRGRRCGISSAAAGGGTTPATSSATSANPHCWPALSLKRSARKGVS